MTREPPSGRLPSSVIPTKEVIIKRVVKGGYGKDDQVVEVPVLKYALIAIVSLAVFIALCVGGVAGCKSFNRSQKRADANNNVKVTQINIRAAQQRAQIVRANEATVQAQADQRVIAAHGLAKAQQIVQSTLTPLYVQFEAIEAQKAIATSGKNNTVIYVPSGTNGTPTITQNADPKSGSVGTP